MNERLLNVRRWHLVPDHDDRTTPDGMRVRRYRLVRGAAPAAAARAVAAPVAARATA